MTGSKAKSGGRIDGKTPHHWQWPAIFMVSQTEMASANPTPSVILGDGVFYLCKASREHSGKPKKSVKKANFMIFNKNGLSFCKIE
ncbi:hypothetical protein AYX07_00740 [Thermoactinomyces sp. AS95]|jgi:hypothetical protein|nr:hypothetical protein AYX07_00740 [Thermoactinomyces sp. AS95]